MKGRVWQRQKELALPLTRSRENICKQMLPVCVYPTLRDFKWKPAPHTVSLPFIIAIFQALGGWRRKTQDNAPLRKLKEVKLGERQAQTTQGHQVGTYCPCRPSTAPAFRAGEQLWPFVPRQNSSVTATDTWAGPKHQDAPAGCFSRLEHLTQAMPDHPHSSLGLKVP